MKKIALHYQIIFGLLLGIVLGALFPVNHAAFVVSHGEETTTIEQFEHVELVGTGSKVWFSETAPDASDVVAAFESVPYRMRQTLSMTITSEAGDFREFSAIEAISKPESFATMLRPLGTLFLNLLKMLALPLVLASLIVGAASLGDIKRMARIGGRSIGLYLATTAAAITIGLVVANVIQPGNAVDITQQTGLIEAQSGELASKLDQELDFSILEFVLSIVPTNPFESFAEGNMLHVVFFAVFFGMMLSLIEAAKSKQVVSFFDATTDVVIKMVDVIMITAPIGVCALMAATIADFGIGILETLIWYVVAVVFGLVLQVVVVYLPMVKILGKRTIGSFLKGVRRAQLLAFSTSSSAATLPVTMECVEEMKVKKSVFSFVLPLGATINMDGTALYQGVSAIFIAQVYGIDLSIAQQLTIVLTATLASIGAAPVPGLGLILLIIVLRSVGLPEEGLALILGVDRILDMIRTSVNVTGDSAVAVVVDAHEKA